MLRWPLVIALSLLASPLLAQSAEKVAEDVALTPAEDVNLKRRDIPEVLLAAGEAPYTRDGARNCRQVIQALSDLDAVLGPDLDIEGDGKRRIDAKGIAKGLVGGLIPFRGVVREISGAAGAQRRHEAAIDAGIARRGFLRGIAASRGCTLPPPVEPKSADAPPTQPAR